jgi:hypothetical protein
MLHILSGGYDMLVWGEAGLQSCQARLQSRPLDRIAAVALARLDRRGVAKRSRLPTQKTVLRKVHPTSCYFINFESF